MFLVLVGATLVANICNSRLKSLLPLKQGIAPNSQNDTRSSPAPRRPRVSAVNPKSCGVGPVHQRIT
jgi:hypothetical protein